MQQQQPTPKQNPAGIGTGTGSAGSRNSRTTDRLAELCCQYRMAYNQLSDYARYLEQVLARITGNIAAASNYARASGSGTADEQHTDMTAISERLLFEMEASQNRQFDLLADDDPYDQTHVFDPEKRERDIGEILAKLADEPDETAVNLTPNPSDVEQGEEEPAKRRPQDGDEISFTLTERQARAISRDRGLESGPEITDIDAEKHEIRDDDTHFSVDNIPVQWSESLNAWFRTAPLLDDV